MNKNKIIFKWRPFLNKVYLLCPTGTMLLEKRKKHGGPHGPWCLAAQMNHAGFNQFTRMLLQLVAAQLQVRITTNEVMIENPAAMFVILND